MTKILDFTNVSQAKKATGLSYIGGVSISQKHAKAETYNEHTYTIYLAPANSSGFEVCPGRTAECTRLCLNMSGRNKIGSYTADNKIEKARIKKTQLLHENREFFVNWVIEEIKTAKAKAEALGFRFSVRLNNTSDISPEMFYVRKNGVKMNLLQIFPDVQFYDYTKVASRVSLVKKYPNYDLTYSFSGVNLDTCLEMLKNNIRVAMVFAPKLPETYLGYTVENGDLFDMRYLQPKNIIVGLKFKSVRNTIPTDSKFVIDITKCDHV